MATDALLLGDVAEARGSLTQSEFVSLVAESLSLLEDEIAESVFWKGFVDGAESLVDEPVSTRLGHAVCGPQI